MVEKAREGVAVPEDKIASGKRAAAASRSEGHPAPTEAVRASTKGTPRPEARVPTAGASPAPMASV